MGWMCMLKTFIDHKMTLFDETGAWTVTIRGALWQSPFLAAASHKIWAVKRAVTLKSRTPEVILDVFLKGNVELQ